MITNATLHYYLLSRIVEVGYAPDFADLQEHFAVDREEVISALVALQEYHGVVLHPHDHSIWVIHPFSLAPANFSIRTSSRQWWGNCAWCSLGAAALLDRDLTITTTLGAEGEQVVINVRDGKVEQSDPVIHFPIPMKKAWENVMYTCSTMLVFENDDQVEDWCVRHKIPRGDVQPIQHIWELSKKWYGHHLDPGWTKWTASGAKAIFKDFGLEHSVWRLDESAERF